MIISFMTIGHHTITRGKLIKYVMLLFYYTYCLHCYYYITMNNNTASHEDITFTVLFDCRFQVDISCCYWSDSVHCLAQTFFYVHFNSRLSEFSICVSWTSLSLSLSLADQWPIWIQTSQHVEVNFQCECSLAYVAAKS